MVAMAAEQRLWTVAEVVDRLRVSPATVTSWLRTGQLRGYRVGGRKAGWRIESSDLERFIEDLKSSRASE